MDKKMLQEFQEVLAKNPFVAQMGIEILEIGTGHVFSRVKTRKELENIYKDMHGGCLYTIADNMAGIAASTCGFYVTTVNGSIQYLRAGRNTEYVFCRAEVIKQGKTLTAVHVEITDDHNTLLNTAEFTYFNLKEKAIS